MPAKQATRWMARASPVFAGMPAPTGIAKLADFAHESCCCLHTPTAPLIDIKDGPGFTSSARAVYTARQC